MDQYVEGTTMLFDKEFIEWIKENPLEGLAKACEIAREKQAEASCREDQHEILWEASSFISHFVEKNKFKIHEFPKATSDMNINCKRLNNYIDAVGEDIERRETLKKINIYKNRYEKAFKNSFAYEFSKSDLDRVQMLINEIRTHISESQSLEENHRLRLLKRLEKLQSELHKRVSDLDRFWGLVGDAGVVLKKLGKDAKPIVDRVREIAEITWKTQAKSENLPSGSQNPMLGQDEDY